MLAEMVAAHKAFRALCTDKSLLARVCSQVPLQLIGAGEPFFTVKPGAMERPLSRMPAEVRT